MNTEQLIEILQAVKLIIVTIINILNNLPSFFG